jgi:hypothetical protein
MYSIWYRPTLYAALQCTDQERTVVINSSIHYDAGQKTIKFLEAIVFIFCCHFQVAEHYCVLRNFINYPYSMILG